MFYPGLRSRSVKNEVYYESIERTDYCWQRQKERMNIAFTM